MHIEMCGEGFWVDTDSEVYEDGVDEPLNPEVVLPTDVNAEFDRLASRVAELEDLLARALTPMIARYDTFDSIVAWVNELKRVKEEIEAALAAEEG